MPTVFSVNTIIALSSIIAAAGVEITVESQCKFDIYPAVAPPIPGQTGGWKAETGSSKVIQVDSWVDGRIWARTGCDKPFGTSSPACKIGDCHGNLECKRAPPNDVGYGGEGATVCVALMPSIICALLIHSVQLAEFGLHPEGPSDFWDVSFNDGKSRTVCRCITRKLIPFSPNRIQCPVSLYSAESDQTADEVLAQRQDRDATRMRPQDEVRVHEGPVGRVSQRVMGTGGSSK